METTLLRWWRRLQGAPGGTRLFSWLLSWLIPYTGSVRPLVRELEPGFARVSMRDRRGVRNHLRCIHAVAQLNLAEFSTGLAMTSRLPEQGRAILTQLSMEYLKKARGTLTAACRCEPYELGEKLELQLVSTVQDASGTVVSRGTAVWLVGPK